VGWILLAVATALVTAKFSWVAVVLQTGGVTLFMVVVLYVVGPVLRAIWRGVAQFSPENTLPRSFLALLLVALFLCAIITNKLGVFSIFGAFALGVALHQETALVRLWRNKLADFVLVALVPIFFTNTGLRTEVGSLSTPMAWLGCGAVLFAATAGKLGGCWLGGIWTGQPKREAACVAALMNTRALMGLVAINIGADLGLLNRQLFTMFVLMALLTTVSTTPLLARWLPREHRP
jgi:Kef-type K+ transport system membrane component KefB